MRKKDDPLEKDYEKRLEAVSMWRILM